MSQRRIRPSLLYENNYGTRYPSPTERTLDASVLNGGLNLWELNYRLSVNQSPDLENMYWNDGCLASRPGQSYLFDQATSETAYGTFYACYEKLWPNDSGYIIAHKGTSIYKIDPTTGAHTQIYTGLTSTTGGSFFVFGKDAKLYYLSGKEYIEITKTYTASAVVGYIPTTVINRTPAGSGGDVYQLENRIAAGKRVQFTSDGTSTAYTLPYQGLDNTTVTAKVLTLTGGSYVWVDKVEGTDFTVNRTTGVVTFNTAPAQQDPVVNNNVEITCYKTDINTVNSILECTKAIAFGSGNDVCVVVGGCPAQPNAYFWSGGNDVEMTATYFPYDYYNYAGSNATDMITGFGRQQSMLVIFQSHSIGKSAIDTTTINERVYISLPYVGINPSIGCDIPGSIRLVSNNLVFANSYNGVYVLLDSTAIGENNVKRISRNVNGDGSGRGLLADLRNAYEGCAFDDGKRYWLCTNTHVYLWDYTLTGYTTKEENISWFFFTGLAPKKWVDLPDDDMLFFIANGSIVIKNNSYNDFGSGFTRRYTFATLNFGTYEVLKDVMKIVFSVRSDTNCVINIKYKTDYEERWDKTPIGFNTWSLVPRNLAERKLSVYNYALSAIRLPRCRHIRHFSMELSNSAVNTDMSIIGAQIVYRYVREDR